MSDGQELEALISQLEAERSALEAARTQRLNAQLAEHDATLAELERELAQRRERTQVMRDEAAALHAQLASTSPAPWIALASLLGGTSFAWGLGPAALTVGLGLSAWWVARARRTWA